ncbi:septation protein IspZ [Clostridium estertheticum]|uniref:septation protein IspZ n=1 Tax=Clostridium estertheticum TaxID=238834 RepID=UPI001C0CF4D2|nr:septation protein IspZ [Clostridium estertheticum]MBU3175261.1 septation protein IspZ [Clostridium estertheticum]
MKQSSNNTNKNQSILKNIFNKEFVISAIIPVIIFSAFDKFKMTLTGVILSGLWCIGVVLIDFIKEHKINALAAMAGIFSAIGLIGTIVSKNPTFYLVAPIVQDWLYALIFFVSLFFERSLVQIIVEQSFLKNVSEEFRRKPKYKSAWRILTCAWGILNISQAVLRMILLHSISMSSYYAISMAYSNISGPLLIAFSISFPKWYWKTGTKS